MIKNMLLAFVGGGTGAVLRLLSYQVIASDTYPYATWFVNIAGSLLMGFILGWAIRHNITEPDFSLLLATGFCGGFTTFSAFSAENIALLQQGKLAISVTYIISSVLLAVAATWLGFKIIQ